MRLYAELPARRARQLVADLVVLCWLAASLTAAAALGRVVWGVGDHLARVGQQTDAAAGQLHDSADSVARLPLVGGPVAAPLRTLGGSLAAIGGGLAGDTASLHRAGAALGVAFAVLGMAVPVLAWCLTRGRWLRRVATVRGQLSEDDLEGLATAAAATAGVRELRRLPPGTVLAWRSGDRAARRLVAGVGLRALGLRPPS